MASSRPPKFRLRPLRLLADLRTGRDGAGSISARDRRNLALLLTLVSAGLVPWSAALAAKLPSSVRVRHWGLAWSGLDLAEAGAAGWTAWLVARGDERASMPAAALAALMVVDAWFDVCTAAPGRQLALAVAEAVALELPLAATAAGIAWRAPAALSGRTGAP